MTLDVPPFRVYLPIVGKPGVPPVVTPVVTNTDDLDPFAAELLRMIREDDRQQRPRLDVHPLLVAACRQRIADMFNHEFYGHFVPDCFSPNDLLRYLHYELPPHYPFGNFGNTVESIAGGQTEPQDVFDGWAVSPDHWYHLFGANDFYRAQVHVGIMFLYVDGGINGKLAGGHDAVTVFMSAP